MAIIPICGHFGLNITFQILNYTFKLYYKVKLAINRKITYSDFLDIASLLQKTHLSK